jgi:hypothetical protein
MPARDTSSGHAAKHTVALQSSGPADPMNMGGLRGIATTDITVTASPALPASVHRQAITLSVPARFARSGTGLGTAYLRTPTFSLPRILEHGALIAFTLCIDASHIGAGSYVGQVIVGGPRGVQPATVTITLNAKDSTLLVVGITIAGLLAAGLLILRSMKAKYDKQDDGQKSVSKAFGDTLKDPLGFWAPSVIAIGGAIVAMLQVYDSNAAWGADQVSSVIALGSTAITAAGVGTFLSSLRGS